MVEHKPVIGVIACNRPVEGEPAQAVKHRYLEALEQFADCVPLIVPSNQSEAHAAEIIARLDAILLTGSNSNIHPSRYGSDLAAQAPHDAGRDQFGSALIHAAMTAAKPVFGICRGLQEINVALGGSLRDLRAGAGADGHHAHADAELAEMFAHDHDVDVATGSMLQRYAGGDRLRVNSVHFQVVDRLGQGLVVNARGPDGVIEAFSTSHTPAPVFAVQWHPEWRPAERPHDLAFWHFVGETARANYMPAPGSELTT